MSERRRDDRHALEQPGVGTVRVIQDVDVKHLEPDHAIVIAKRPIPLGERLLLEIPHEKALGSYAWLARAVNSRVLLGHGALVREVRLAITERPGDAQAIEEFASGADWGKVIIGAVIRRVPVRLLQASASGCEWESPAPLDAGTVGFVDVRSSDRPHTEAVRILRTWRAVGPLWPYRMAVEFLTLGPASPESFRGVAALVAAGTPSTNTQ